MCKISIILPVYNVEKYLLRCLESISNQTFKDFEIIAINDGATDSSLRILEEYTNKEKRLKIFSQENQGLSAARNIGMKNAKGEYIYFLDSDDAIHPQLLEIVYDFATKHSADLVCFDYQKSDGISLNTSSISIDKIKPKITFTPLFEGRKLIKFNVWNKLYKRDLIKDITYIDNINFEDYPFTYAVLAKHPKTVFINSVLYFYTINMSSITKQKANPKMIEDYFKGLCFVYDIYKNDKYSKELNFLKKDFIPGILKHQIDRVRLASNNKKNKMVSLFTEELLYLKERKLLSLKGHKIKNWLTYQWLIWKGR